MENELINHVSDTALWIAGYRALESEKPDAVFKDPLAARLAGKKGEKMAATMPHANKMFFAMVVRTSGIDKLVEMAIGRGVDTIINLGAGLDTRPYRMMLPLQLNWIEVDFPHLLAYKNELLAGDTPVCRLERIGCDLSIKEERVELFARLGARAQKALIITEGVIAYMSNDQAASFADDLHAIPSFRYWIMDYAQGKMRKTGRSKPMAKKLKHAPILFNVADPLHFFGQHGWKTAENIYILDEADRIGRKLPVMFPWSILMKLFPGKIREMANKTFGYVMFAAV